MSFKKIVRQMFDLTEKEKQQYEEKMQYAVSKLVSETLMEHEKITEQNIEVTITQEQSPEEEKTISQWIEEIHGNFYSASDKLLKDAQEIINGTHIDEEALMLASLGFNSMPKVQQARHAQYRLVSSQVIADTVLHYQTTYPKYKFITEDIVDDICKKYNLVFGGVERYKGEVPSKNVKEILAFDKSMILESDRTDKRRTKEPRFNSGRHNAFLHHLDDMDLIYWRQENEGDGFMICAPLNDMVINRGEEVINNRIVMKEIPDPVLLYPVRGGYLVISAWGDEAADVVNEKMN